MNNHIPIHTNDGRINLHSGKVLDFRKPTPEMIDICDIAIGLAREPRFQGQTRTPIRVALHSMFAFVLAKEEFKFSMLMHDAHEAYTGDICSPLKSILGNTLKHIEKSIDAAIEQKYGVDLSSDGFKAEKKRVDSILIELEYYAFHNHNNQNQRAVKTSSILAMLETLKEDYSVDLTGTWMDNENELRTSFEFLTSYYISHP